MEMLLLNPPIQRPTTYKFLFQKFTFFQQFLLPPLGLISIAACLEKVCNIQILDANVKKMNVKKTVDKIISESPDLVGITANTSTYTMVKQILSSLKESGIQTIVGGPHPTICFRDVLNDGADYVVLGEGEVSSVELVKCLMNRRIPLDISGIAFIKNKKLVYNQNEMIPDLNKLPMRAWHMLDIRKYRPSPASFKKLPAISTITSRGCPFNCNFCCKKIFGRI